MYPILLDFLANNDHTLSTADCGTGHVAFCTAASQTVTYGSGPYGELGFGKTGPKSSSQPKFVEAMDGADAGMVKCGYGTTLFLVGGELEEWRKRGGEVYEGGEE